MLRRRLRTGLAALGGLLLTTGLAAAGATSSALYRVRFQADWSAGTHPDSFPGNPHFSALIGGVHGDGVSFWNDGGLASPGIEAMAELGATSPLDQEVQAAITAGTAQAVLRGGGVGPSPGSTTLDFEVTSGLPRVTLVTMVAPSPDWFAGVSGLSLLEDGDWLEERVVPLDAWDAGTDSGASYTSANADTVPAEPIRRIDTGPLGNGTPIGTFTFTRLDSPPAEALLLRGGRFRVTVEWRDFELDEGHGTPVTLSDETGLFWFFDPDNVELVVKVLDGCTFNDHFWIFAAGLTNLEVTLTVEDTESGEVNVYDQTLGDPFEPLQDIGAFATCP